MLPRKKSPPLRNLHFLGVCWIVWERLVYHTLRGNVRYLQKYRTFRYSKIHAVPDPMDHLDLLIMYVCQEPLDYSGTKNSGAPGLLRRSWIRDSMVLNTCMCTAV